MFDCKDFVSNIEKYLDKELTEREQLEFEAHLEKCPSCRSELAFSISVRRALLDMKLPDPPADFLEKVNSAIDREGFIKQKPMKRYLSWKTCSTVAACLMIAVLLGVNTNKLTDSLLMPATLAPDNGKSSIVSPGNNAAKTPDSSVSENAEAKKPSPSTKTLPTSPFANAPTATQNADTSTRVGTVTQDQATTGSQAQEQTSQGGTQQQATSDQAPVLKNSEQAPSDSQTDQNEGTAAMQNKSASPVSENDAENGDVQSASLRMMPPEATDTDKAESGSGGGAGAATATFDGPNMLMTINALGNISVSEDMLSQVKDLATEYGECQDDLYEMTKEKYSEFLKELDSQNIAYTTSVEDGDTVSFEIISQ